MTEKVTLFAGAGFSRFISENIITCKYKCKNVMPCANDIFSFSKDYLCYKKFGYKDLGDYLQEKYGTRFPLRSYEDIYNILDDNKKRLLENMLFQLLGADYPPIRYPDECYETIKLIRDGINKNEISDIITSNPDLLIDIAIAGSTQFDEILNKYKLNKNIKLIPIDGKPVFKKRKYCPLEKIESLIKVHGSLNYLRCEDNDKKLYIYDKYVWKKGIAVNYYINEISKKCNKEKLIFCVIPPLTDKSTEYGNWPWKHLLESAEKVISETDKLIVFGFGFSDNDRALIELFKKYKNKVEIYDINSCDSGFKKRARSYFNENANICFNSNISSFFARTSFITLGRQTWVQ